ncbi:MAG: hypothetical protein HY828_16545 [Actinobacteria bacterium]|nr:hypothetical protein [Actinomycetota bacterium]
MRSAWLFVLAALVVGCSDDPSSSPTSGVADTAATVASDATSTTSAPAFTSIVPAPDSTIDNVFAAADVETVCEEANRAAYAHAEQLGYWTHPLTAPEQLQYFQIRGGTVDVMVASLGTLSGDQVVDVPAAVDALSAYNDWVHAQVATIEQTGETVSEDHGGVLDTARTALGGTGACGDLFDMN